MSRMHPHWQSTDDQEQPVRITSVQKHKQHPYGKKSAVRASRKPAAIAGITIMLVVGFFWSGGLSNFSSLSGQVSSSVRVNITSNGTSPETVTVSPGQTIVWINNDTIPHILASDTLPTANGQPFMTSAIFPNTSTQYTVPQNAPTGTYKYISKTAQNVSGHIIIQATASPQQQSTSATSSTAGGLLIPSLGQQESSSAAAFVPAPVAATSSEPSAPQPSTAPPLGQVENSTGQPSTSLLPDNPHTVGTAPSLPKGSQTTAPTASVTTHTPTGVPKTGPDVDVIIALSVVAVLWFSRKALRSIA